MRNSYRYSISFTSQFPFCSVPLRLDSYSKCQFACRYCFAAARGGSRPEGPLQVASSERLSRLLGAAEDGRGGVVGELFRSRVPIHFGGMADPFPKMEDRLGVSFDLLKILASAKYPTILSAKGVPADKQKYIEVISGGNMMVQFSFSVVKPELSRLVDAGAPSWEQRLDFMRELSRAGVVVALRLQPVFPGHENHAIGLIRSAALAGARHVAIEFLKYPVEAGWAGLENVGVVDSGRLLDVYIKSGATRIGREWVLPVSYRVPHALWMRGVARSEGLTFAFADNDLLHFSDGDACCTGSDIHLDARGLAFNFHHAVKRADANGVICYSSIENEWRPNGSLAQYLNSNSRARGVTLERQILNGWNGSSYAPDKFYGVDHFAEWDRNGRKIYRLDPSIRAEFI